MNTPTPNTLADYIIFHLRGSGPCSFTSVLQWVKRQYDYRTDAPDVAAALNALIVKGHARLADDGDSFDFSRPPTDL